MYALEVTLVLWIALSCMRALVGTFLVLSWGNIFPRLVSLLILMYLQMFLVNLLGVISRACSWMVCPSLIL